MLITVFTKAYQVRGHVL